MSPDGKAAKNRRLVLQPLFLFKKQLVRLRRCRAVNSAIAANLIFLCRSKTPNKPSIFSAATVYSVSADCFLIWKQIVLNITTDYGSFFIYATILPFSFTSVITTLKNSKLSVCKNSVRKEYIEKIVTDALLKILNVKKNKALLINKIIEKLQADSNNMNTLKNLKREFPKRIRLWKIS